MRSCGKLLFLSYILNIFDLAATMLLVINYGIGIEGNPIGRVLLSSPALAVGYKTIGIGLLLLLIYRLRKYKAAVIGSYVIFCTYLLLGIYHVALMAAV